MFALPLVGAKVSWGIKLLATARVFAFPGPVGERDVARLLGLYSAFLVPALSGLHSALSGLHSALSGLHSALSVLWETLVFFISGFFSFSFFPFLHLVGVLFGSSKEVGRVLTGEPSINVVEEQFGLVGLAFLESFKVERLQDEHRICVFES